MRFPFALSALALLFLVACGTPVDIYSGKSAPKKEHALLRKSNDADNDGIANPLDRCPGTEPGIAVDVYGCPHDRDGDGVYDYRDLCPDTPQGITVGPDGCPLDEDGDGVADSRDRCPGTPTGTPVNMMGCPKPTPVKEIVKVAPEPIVEPEPLASQVLLITFHTGSARLTDVFSDEFARGADFIQAYPGSRVTIEGHTDNVGPAAWNLKLSLLRAETARTELLRHLGKELPIEVAGYGESRPAANNDTQQGRLQNRRVVIRIDPPNGK